MLPHLLLSTPAPHVLHVQINRPNSLNAINDALFDEIAVCFQHLPSDTRAVVFSGAGRCFTAGLDVKETPSFVQLGDDDSGDVGRRAIKINHHIRRYQAAASSIEACPVPVIAAVHGACIGAGVDFITACDIRLCTSDAFFSVKEVDIGLAADVGTLQRLPRCCGNSGWVKEMCMTARRFDATEAAREGLVRSPVFASYSEMIDVALDLAKSIASKSPVAVHSTKHLLNYSRDHSVSEGLMYTAAWNASMLQTQDITMAMMANRAKTPAVYAKL